MTALAKTPMRALPQRLRRCKSGLALVEFAISLPVLLALALYGFETANLAIANLRMSNMAMLVADNAARQRDTIDEANVVELLAGAKMTGTSMNFAANGRIILSSLRPTADASAQWINWQRCDGALNVNSSYGRPRTAGGAVIANGTEIYGTDRTAASTAPSSHAHASARMTAVGPAGRQISAQPGTAVMVVEIVYNYQPVVGNYLFGPIQLRYESAFNVRQRNDHDLKNGGRITPKSCNIVQA